MSNLLHRVATMHPGSVQTDCAQFQHTGLLGEQEHLNGEILQFGQKRAPG